MTQQALAIIASFKLDSNPFTGMESSNLSVKDLIQRISMLPDIEERLEVTTKLATWLGELYG